MSNSLPLPLPVHEYGKDAMELPSIAIEYMGMETCVPSTVNFSLLQTYLKNVSNSTLYVKFLSCISMEMTLFLVYVYV